MFDDQPKVLKDCFIAIGIPRLTGALNRLLVSINIEHKRRLPGPGDALGGERILRKAM